MRRAGPAAQRHLHHQQRQYERDGAHPGGRRRHDRPDRVAAVDKAPDPLERGWNAVAGGKG
ncbi:hypothetical protein [Streptomyces sp. NPDC052107]|uniref:hypothetical protein n=1 Tax=Streptomyces sp. NPDC052107 TaxID=3155632 RepID=UPI00341D230C